MLPRPLLESKGTTGKGSLKDAPRWHPASPFHSDKPRQSSDSSDAEQLHDKDSEERRHVAAFISIRRVLSKSKKLDDAGKKGPSLGKPEQLRAAASNDLEEAYCHRS